MKKSEMLELMAEEIIHIEDDKDIERLLDKMLDAGMLPPARYRYKDWNETGLTYSQWIQLPSKINEWDKE